MKKNDLPDNHYIHTERWICDVLGEMRKCVATMNFAYLPGLIEEAQTLANRMEAGLESQKTYSQIHADSKVLEAMYIEKKKDYDAMLKAIATLKEQQKS